MQSTELLLVGSLLGIMSSLFVVYLLLEINAFFRNRKRFAWPKRAIIEQTRIYTNALKNSFVIIEYHKTKNFLKYLNWDDGYGKYNSSIGKLNVGDILLVPKRWGGYFVTVVDSVDYAGNLYHTNFLGVMYNDHKSITQNVKKFGIKKARRFKFIGR